MKEKESLLKNLSLNVINHWIRYESNQSKKEAFRCLKSEKMKLTNPKMGEVIKVIEEDKLIFKGYTGYTNNIAKIIESNTINVERSYAEFDERYRQIVSNAILITQDEKGEKYYGFLQRNRLYTEGSLIGTIGMTGGHYNSNDINMYSCLVREVSEETKGIPFEYSKIKPLGFIKESNNTISNYHVCVLYTIEIPYEYMGKIKSKEPQESLLWITEVRLKEKLKNTLDESDLDSWCETAVKKLLNY